MARSERSTVGFEKEGRGEVLKRKTSGYLNRELAGNIGKGKKSTLV